jgi:hypothetical protein
MSSEETRGSITGDLSNPGPYLARVVSHLDRTYSGYLQVEILQESGNTEARQAQLHSVRYLSPFSGQTSSEYLAESNDYNSTQKAYGFWMVPPDPGALVVVIFIDSDPKKGFWIGCVHDINMNFSVPGHAATTFHVDGKKARVPVTEYNKLASSPVPDTTKIKKPASKLQDKLLEQGTLEDDIRGITTSSARREIPSMVFGISTPGPSDKTGKQGPVGKHEYKIPNAVISRLGGSEFVMDDGDDKWEREKLPKDGPPVYKSVEDGEKGLRDRPHNELIRFRTRTGHQILMHNSEDLIYIGNSRGTAWIELTSDGKMDVYCEDSINFRTKQDFNFYADRDINMHAGRNFNIKVNEEMHTHVVKDSILIVDKDQKIHIKANVDKTYDGNYQQHVKGNVDKRHAASWSHTVGGESNSSLGGSLKTTISGSFDLNVGGHVFTTSGGSNETNAGGNIVEQAPQIHMNGPAASTAAEAAEATEAVLPEPLTPHNLPDLPKPDGSIETKELIVRRMPTPEPYPQHENIDPLKYKPEKTDRDADGRYGTSPTETMAKEGEYWKKYSTTTDTFAKVGK